MGDNKPKSSCKEKLMTAGRIIFGILVAFIVYIDLGLVNKLPNSATTWTLGILTLFYVVYTIKPTQSITDIFSVICIISGLFFMKENLLLGFLLLTCGIILIFIRFWWAKKTKATGQQAKK